MRVLAEDNSLCSDLWLDQPDALEAIDKKRLQGLIGQEDAARLTQFSEKGYLSFPISDTRAIDRVDEDIDSIWHDRPHDLAFSNFAGPRTSFFYARSISHRRPGYRFADPHGHSEALQELYLHPAIFRVVELIFGQAAIAFQSLYFEWGSEHGLHRDPVVVVTKPRSHLVGAWIALEDIHPDSGPLRYVPGSHRLPWFDFGEGDVVKKEEYSQNPDPFYRELIANAGLKHESLICKKGTVLLWHAGLFHGGAPIKNKRRSRKSFVIHFSTLAHYPRSRSNDMFLRLKGQSSFSGVTKHTTEVLERRGCSGIQAPLLGGDWPLQPTSHRQEMGHLAVRGLRRLSKMVRNRLGV